MLTDTRGATGRLTLIRGARVYDRALDVHRPPIRDVIVDGNRIASVTTPDELAELKARIADDAEQSDPAPAS